MLSFNKNSEARECANTSRASIENNRVGNIDMNIVAKSDYNFQGFAFNPVTEGGSIWFTSTELAKALGYKKNDAISQIFARNADEFSESMSLTLNMKVNGINNSLRNKSVRVYSLRGAHLIAMFASTPKAKEFRRWVLDILEREVHSSPIAKQFTDDELCSLAWLWRAGDIMLKACDSVTPLLKVAEHRQAGHFHSIGHELPRSINKARDLIKRETAHIEFHQWKDDNWSRVLPHLRQEVLQ
ncbi:P22AR C-terminal domain-containing protein [Enterobacter cloacae subsp. cloacae]|uniref:P22AR C-terminal domain-containing protein n=1 Tax=Enterobacter cloacae TaxID=550 RepID=UPI0025B1E709|nr:P22AR C-terminal domain-containing protein [Enterobacter cloacae]WLD34075.1 P22AR C-terminal domain-containing protein [Enterobacter cloacae subsp. cloacae]